MSEAPSLPYPQKEGGPTAGWSGSSASEERAVTEVKTGIIAARHRQVLNLLSQAGLRGLTVADLRLATGMHHGQASSALSVLHKESRIVRLRDKRNRCHIYVLPVYANSRPSEPQGRKRNDRVKEAFIAGYRSGHEGSVATWEAEIAYDLWERSNRG